MGGPCSGSRVAGASKMAEPCQRAIGAYRCRGMRLASLAPRTATAALHVSVRTPQRCDAGTFG